MILGEGVPDTDDHVDMVICDKTGICTISNCIPRVVLHLVSKTYS